MARHRSIERGRKTDLCGATEARSRESWGSVAPVEVARTPGPESWIERGAFDVLDRVLARPREAFRAQLGGGSASPVHNVVPAWLEMNGKPRDFIRLLRLDPAVISSSLVEGKIDLVECWKASDRAVMQRTAAASNLKVAWIDYADYGLNAYGSGFAASEATINGKPELVRRFLRGAYRGFQEAIANPEQAADTLVKMFPIVDRGLALQQIREIGELIQDPGAGQPGLGYIRDDRIRSTLGFVDKAYDLKGKVRAEDIYTNQLLK